MVEQGNGKVLGIDPGTLRMGYGVVEKGARHRAVDYGVISVPDKMQLNQRLQIMYRHVRRLIKTFNPDSLAVESPFVGTSGRSFPNAALAVGQAQAAVFIAAAEENIEVSKYAPAEVKKAVTGHGGASKEQIRLIAAATLDLPKIEESDAADALAVAICHLSDRGAQEALLRNELPRTARSAPGRRAR